MGIKLGDVSPLAGIMTGKGLIGKAAGNGLLGVAPYFIAKDAQKDDARSAAEAAALASKKEEGAPAMAKGGSVRGAGCAVRGVKKCKMR